MQLSPKAPIPTAWTASIPTDTTLYYVQAVLRDTNSSAILQTVNLTRVSATPNRYVGTFNPVSDPSGLGRPVDITVSVYEDSGYTTLSTNYEILQTQYVVLQPFIANLGNGGGGSNVSYEKIAATVIAAVEAGKKGDDVKGILYGALQDMPQPEPVDYDRIAESIEGVVSPITDAHTKDASVIIAEIRNAIAGLRSHATQMGEKSQTSMDDRLSKLERAIGEFGATHSRNASTLRMEMQRGIASVRDDMRKEYAGSGDKIRNGVTDGITKHLMNTLGDREVHVHMGTKEDKQSGQFDPNRISKELF